jgi:hypothetical protein
MALDVRIFFLLRFPSVWFEEWRGEETQTEQWDYSSIDKRTGRECLDEEASRIMLESARKEVWRRKAFVGEVSSQGHKLLLEKSPSEYLEPNRDAAHSPSKVLSADRQDAMEAISFDDSDFRLTTVKQPECRPLEADEIDFTLVTQFSMNRLGMVGQQCRLWGRKRPVSVAVYTNLTEVFIKDKLSSVGCHPSTTTLQLLDPAGYPSGSYPTNVLRNMATSAVLTSHAVYVDAETLVSKGLYDNIFSQTAYLKDPKALLVMPAFEYRPACRKNGTSCFHPDLSDVPLSRDELLELWLDDGEYEQDVIQPTYAEFRWGQSSTPYSSWRHQVAGDILTVDCVEVDSQGKSHWEPYFVAQICHGFPLAQEPFMW